MTPELKRKGDEPRCKRCGRLINRLKSFIKIKGKRNSHYLTHAEDEYYHNGCLEVVIYE